MVVTPLKVVGDSKMSGEEPSLEVHYSQDKTQEQFRIQNSLITQAEFLFYSKFNVSLHEAKHPIYKRRVPWWARQEERGEGRGKGRPKV